jgi:FkbM family methyltransferase
MNKKIINFIKEIFKFIGYDIYKLRNSYRHNLLGLRNFQIKTIIDGGANRGQFAKSILNHFPNARILSFEPCKEAFDELDNWAKNNTCGRVIAFNVALGEMNSTVKIYQHKLDWYSSILKYKVDSPDIVQKDIQIRTLDKFISDQSIQINPDLLIKLDVQGYEDRVIRGGVNTFLKAKAILLEVHFDHVYDGQANFKDILTSMEDLGFKYAGNFEQSYADDGHVQYVDALFLKREALT